MKKICTVLFCVALSCTYAQDTVSWKAGGFGSLVLSQTSLTNWASGGQNSVAINGMVGLFANKTLTRSKWENTLNLSYGLIKQGSDDFSKSDDLINFVTKYDYKIKEDNDKWYYSALFDFRSQFSAGYETPNEVKKISNFMAPGYLTIGLGLSYEPTDKLSFSYQPLTGKFTFVLDQDLANAGAFGVTPAVFDATGTNVRVLGKKSRSEFGSFFRAKYKNEFFESRLELFSGYLENQGEVDVNWQNFLVFDVIKVLSVNVFTHLIYDKDILTGVDENDDGDTEDLGELKARVQFKSVIGVGLTYKFGEQKEE